MGRLHSSQWYAARVKVQGTVKAAPDDFGREFLDMIIAAKLVDGVEGAMAHIRTYGSNHTEAILTENDTVKRSGGGGSSSTIATMSTTSTGAQTP